MNLHIFSDSFLSPAKCLRLIVLITVPLLLTSLCNSVFAQYCVGQTTTVSITRSIGCGSGVGSNAQWDGPSGGTISDPGGMASDFQVTWTTAGTFRLKRTFPSGCMSTVIYSSYYTVAAKPATPLASEVSQTPSCGSVTLNYTGASSSAYWQTSPTGGSTSNQTAMVVTAPGTYYVRILSGSCWSDARSITVSSIPAAPVGGTLSGGGTWNQVVNVNLSLSGYSGSIKEYRYTQDGAGPYVVANTSSSINVSYSNSGSSTISRTYWAVITASGCDVNSASTTVNVTAPPPPSMTVCVGQTTSHSITRSIGCGAGTGSNATFVSGSGGTINDPGGSASSFDVTWTTPGTYTLKRSFPSGCATQEILGETVLVYAKPPAPLSTEVNQQAVVCGQVTLNYTGGASTVYWQTSSGGTDTSYPVTRVVTSTGNYYARVRNANGCWSDGQLVAVSTIPASPVGGTLAGGGTYYGTVNITLSLSGHSGSVKEYRYNAGSGDVVVANTTASLPVSFSNSTGSAITRQYRAIILLNGCEVSSTIASVSVNPLPPPSMTVCVGQTTSHSITRSIGCGAGTGSNATFVSGSGGIINDPGGSASSFDVTWTTPGTYTLKRTFPAGCATQEIIGETVLVNAKPATPLATEVNQQAVTCGQVTLNYTGGVSSTYWQTSPGGTDQSFAITRVVTATGNYYARVKDSNGCWSDGRLVTVSTIPASPVGGTLASSGTYYGTVNITLSLSGHSGTIKEYRYNAGSGDVTVANTTASLPVSFTNSTGSAITRQYRAIIQLNGCEVSSSIASVSVNPLPPPSMTVCVGQTTSHSITRSIGCGAGPGSNATFVSGSGGTINDPGGSASSFDVTWTTPGTYTLKRTFPAGCSAQEIIGETVLVNPKPATPLATEVNQQAPTCAQVTLNYTGSVPTTYWQTSSGGTDQSFPLTRVVTSTGNYYARVKDSNGCWSDGRVVSVTTIPASPVGGTLASSGNFFGTVNITLTLSGHFGNIKEYRYNSGGADVIVTNTTASIPVSFSNATSSAITRQYWAVLMLNGCEVNSSIATITVNPLPPPSMEVCVGQTTTHSITRSIGCGAGWGSNATFVSGSGGTINDPGGSASSFDVTWTTPGTYTLKRTFPAGCAAQEIIGETILVKPTPATPLAAHVSQQDGPCGTIILNYTGPSTEAYWQTSSFGVDRSFKNTKTVSTIGNYYLRIDGLNGCWSSPLTHNVAALPATAEGGTLSGTGTYNEFVNITLTLSGHNGTVKEYWYIENGGAPVKVPVTTITLPILVANTTNANIIRQYWAVLEYNGCTDNSSIATITITPMRAIETPEVSFSCSATTGYVVLTSNNSADRWYSVPTGGSALNTTNSVQVSTSPATYYLERTASDGRVFREAYTVDQTFSRRCTAHLNYVKIYKPKNPMDNITTSEPPAQVDKKITYMDGVGLPIQEIAIANSPQQKDVVRPIVYDNNLREARKYLPYVDNTSDGSFKIINFAPDGNYTHNFYNTSGDNIVDDLKPFSDVVYEPSPLNRPSKEYGTGQAWSAQGNNKFVQMDYLLNVNNPSDAARHEEIIAWVANPDGSVSRKAASAGIINTQGLFESNQLSVKSVKDEHGYVVREYTDKAQRIILKKVQVIQGAALGSTAQWAHTYYVYDVFGNLKVVLPPESVSALLSN